MMVQGQGLRPGDGAVIVSVEAYRLILGHAQDAFPMEACGLLVGGQGQGKRWRITQAIPCRNLLAASDAGLRGFEIDPQDLFRVQKALRDKGGGQVVGHYHSHPNGRLGPSPTDIIKINDDSCLWAIASLSEEDKALGFQPTLGLWKPWSTLDGFDGVDYSIGEDEAMQ